MIVFIFSPKLIDYACLYSLWSAVIGSKKFCVNYSHHFQIGLGITI